jgi:SPP1 family predicted phage head-tail adaptor
MKIGEFKHRINIVKPVIEINENGFEAETYETYKTLWAKVTNLHGKEYFEAAAVQKERTVKFIFRAVKGIDETMKIDFGGSSMTSRL